MPLPLIAGAKVATQLAPLIAGVFHKRKKGPNFNQVVADYRKRRAATGATPEDVAAAGRTRAGITASAERSGEIARQNAGRQAIARNLGGPAAAALTADADSLVATGREAGATAEAGQIYDAAQRNKGVEDTIFGAQVGNAQFEAQRNDMRDQTFWNSMLDLTSATSALWQPPASSTAGVAAGAPVAAGTPAPSTQTAIPGIRGTPSKLGYPTYNPNVRPR